MAWGLLVMLRAAARLRRVLDKQPRSTWAQPDLESAPEPEPEPSINPLLQYVSSGFDTANMSTKPKINQKQYARIKAKPRFQDVIERIWCDSAHIL